MAKSETVSPFEPGLRLASKLAKARAEGRRKALRESGFQPDSTMKDAVVWDLLEFAGSLERQADLLARGGGFS